MWHHLACVVIIAALAPDPASAQETPAQFYRGKKITVIVGSSAGGGYDIYARLLARHMPKHIPGNPAMVVTNMAGAGSNAAAAHLFNVAPKDGTVIAALQNSAVLDSLPTRCSATPSGCGTTPRNSSISAPRPSTTTSASRVRTRP